eukprot:1145431-Pelagomonas_calceolata.AAC.14
MACAGRPACAAAAPAGAKAAALITSACMCRAWTLRLLAFLSVLSRTGLYTVVTHHRAQPSPRQ